MNQAPPAAVQDLQHASHGELDARARSRGSRVMSFHEGHVTSVAEFVRLFEADVAAEVVENRELWYAVVDGFASEADVKRAGGNTGNLSYFEGRESPYLRKFVEAVYFRHNKLIKVSHYCGVFLPEEHHARLPGGVKHTEATVLAIEEASRPILRAADQHPEIELRHAAFYVSDGKDWHQSPQLDVAPAPVERCATCDELIYYANEQWRHKATGRAEALVNGRGLRGQPMKKLDHLADPTEQGRLV